MWWGFSYLCLLLCCHGSPSSQSFRHACYLIKLSAEVYKSPGFWREEKTVHLMTEILNRSYFLLSYIVFGWLLVLIKQRNYFLGLGRWSYSYQQKLPVLCRKRKLLLCNTIFILINWLKYISAIIKIVVLLLIAWNRNKSKNYFLYHPIVSFNL